MNTLIERLRAGTGGGSHWMELHKEAADRIEELEARLLANFICPNCGAEMLEYKKNQAKCQQWACGYRQEQKP